MDVTPTQHQIESQAEVPVSRGRRVVVYLTLVLAVLLALGLISSIGLRWMTQRTPSSIVIFHADASLADATITITSDDQSGSRTAHVPKIPDFTAPLFLEPGSYSFSVQQNGTVVFQDSMYVAEGSRYDVDVSPHPTTKP